MSFAFLKDALAGANWSLIAEVGLDAATVALAWWLFRPMTRPTPPVGTPVRTPRAPRARKFRSVVPEATKRPHKLLSILPRTTPGRPLTGFADLATAVPLPPSPPPRKKKSVAFDLSSNQVKEVEPWFITAYGRKHQVNRGVRFYAEVVMEVDRWIVPHGRHQLNFPRTKWIRDAPEDVVDDDGDIDMLDN
ncbi:MAG: hypothetical protein M1830_009958 [Pleopsidium flavum]|nr:MAG: hypothetical protein M1830_010552 [Pleopsidium flavum]KAI9874246.1 MAG: hypothetical protein M1830_009958 [Pleopsidium flavum]